MQITPDLLLKAYASGIFPMAEHQDDPELYWYEPNERGILPLDAFHVSGSLAKTVRKGVFTISVDQDFARVIDGCAGGGPDRKKTWINSTIRDLYGALFDRGYCHTVEARIGNELVGGLYGVALGGAFFGESMFHRATDASKTCLVHLVARLKLGGYRLLDAQFVTQHLATFGAISISKRDYRMALGEALSVKPDPSVWTRALTADDVLECIRGR